MSGKTFFQEIDKNFAKIVQLHKSLIPEPGSHNFETELFKKLLDKDFDINYRIPDSYNVFENNWVAGCTIFQLVRSIPDVYQSLIDHGADYIALDKEGSTVLLRETTSYDCSYSRGSSEVYDKTICTGYGHYLASLSGMDMSRHSADDKESCANIVLSAHINSENPTNPKDKNGLSHFHVACMYNRSDVAKFFLDNGVPINETVNQDSKFYPGYSALHFAAKSCAVETVELLLTRGADIFAKDSKGMTPLHTLMVERKKALIKVKTDEPKFIPMDRFAASLASILGIPFSLYSNLHNHHSKNQKIISLLLEKMNEHGYHFHDDTQLSYFHILCFTGDTSSMKKLLDDNIQYLSHKISIDSPIWRGYTPLHCAANFNVETVEFLVKMGADLSVKDANGETPFDICLREFTIADVHKILSLQPDYFNITFLDSITKLGDFIHAMQDCATFETFLDINLCKPYPNRIIPLDSPVCAGYTFLHLAVICAEQPMNWSSKSYDIAADHAFSIEKLRRYFLRIELCLSKSRKSVTSENTRGSTPLHWAFRLQKGQAVRMLLKLHTTNSNCIDEQGLSHLHIACAAGNETMVHKLVTGGANVNSAVTSSYIWLEKNEVGRVSNLVTLRWDKYVINKGSNSLHFALKWPKIVEILIRHQADVLAQDADGFNPLERLLGIRIFEDLEYSRRSRPGPFNENEEKVILLLLRKIGEQLADTKPRQMLYYYSLLEDELLGEILDHGDESATKILESAGITALHVACFTQKLSQVEKLAREIDVNARVSVESPLWPGCTPMHLFTKSAILSAWRTNWEIATELLERGADVGAVNLEGETPIHGLFLFNWYHLNEKLKRLQDFSVNPTSKKGFSHLHIASVCGAVSIVQQLLDHGAPVDQPTDYFIKEYGGFTALHFAALHKEKDVVNVLLNHGANVNGRDAFGENALHVASKGKRSPCLSGAEVHAKNMYGETPFEALIKSTKKAKKEIELFLEHDCRVNIYDSESNEGLLAIALNNSSYSIFEIMVKASDVKAIDNNGRNAIHNVVAFKLPDKNYSEEEEEDIAEFGFEELFEDKYASSDDYVRAVALLIEFGINIDHQDCEGFTPLHVAVRMQNVTGIIGLLENGADVNVTDARGNTAFEYALKLDELYYFGPDFRIMKIISTHIDKLNMAKIGISVANKQIKAKILEKQEIDVTELTDEYTVEVEKMKEEQITSTSIALRKFLSNTDAVSAFPYMQLCDKTAIESFFTKEIKNLRIKFPYFAGILLLQYRKALARGDLIDSAATSLDILVGFDMPLICTDIILKFLSNDELNNLISSVAVE